MPMYAGIAVPAYKLADGCLRDAVVNVGFAAVISVSPLTAMGRKRQPPAR